jgi:hypothetical protein
MFFPSWLPVVLRRVEIKNALPSLKNKNPDCIMLLPGFVTGYLLALI